jgi:hypothetical protein
MTEDPHLAIAVKIGDDISVFFIVIAGFIM